MIFNISVASSEQCIFVLNIIPLWFKLCHLFHQKLNANGKPLRKFYLGSYVFLNKDQQLVYENGACSLLLSAGQFDF
jgi:hypothetical protein